MSNQTTKPQDEAASTYEEMMSKAKQLHASGDTASAKRLAKIALSRKQKQILAVASARTRLKKTPQAAQNEPKIPEGMFFNPVTNQITSRELLKNNMNTPSNLDSVALGGSQGITFGLGDEAAALGGFVRGGADEANFKREKARAMFEKSQETNPVMHLGGQIAGGVTTGIAGGGRFIAGQTGKTLAARSAAVGGTEGAMIGFNEGEGGFENRLGNAGTGAVLGTLMGGAAPAITKAGGAALGAVANPIRGIIDAALNRASPTRVNRMLAKGVQRSGQTPEELQAAISRAAQEGQPEFILADAMGNSGQRMLSGVARQPGSHRQEIVELLRKRQINQGDRLSGFVSEAFDAPDTAATRRATMTETRGQAADASFDAARGNAAPVDVHRTLEAIDARIGGMQGSGVVGDGIDAKLVRYRQRLATDGKELSDFDRVLGVKQAVQDDIGAAVRSGRNNEARELGKLSKALDAALEDASPNYRKANDEFATASREIDAIDTGKGFTRPSTRAADNVNTFQNMTPKQRAAARVGYADPVLAKMGNAAEGANKARPLTSSKAQAELGAMTNDPSLLQRRIQRENTMFDTNTQALGGSKTADNLADMEDVSGNIGMITNLLSGRLGAAAADGSRKLGSIATGQNEATRALLLKLLTSKDAKGIVSKAVGQSQKDMRTKRIIEALMRQGTLQPAVR